MSEKEINRLHQWRLGIIHHAEEVSHNVAKTCRYFGISRSIFYHWYERYQQYGPDGSVTDLGAHCTVLGQPRRKSLPKSST